LRAKTFPQQVFHLPHKCAAKQKKGDFRSEKSNEALAAEKRWRDGDQMYSSHQYAEPHSRHWPKSPIKSSQANAGGEQVNAVCAQCAGKFRRRGAENAEKGRVICFCPARLWWLLTPKLDSRPY